MIIATQGARLLSPCRPAAPVEETVPRPSYPDAAPYYHACPLSHPHHAQQEPEPAGDSPPVRAVHRPSSPEAVPHIELAQLASTPPTVPLSSPTP